MQGIERVGVIGGTGLYLMDGFEDVREVAVETPFGNPSDVLTIGRVGNREVVFLPRHGRGHRFLPTEVNYRANIWAMKSLGVSRIFSVSAVGSMKLEITLARPVLISQFIDRTVARQSTFFGQGIVAHVSMADSTCNSLRSLVAMSAVDVGIDVVDGGTYVCIEGPQFSSRAESHAYRALGVDVIGMTNATEAKLAREAEICYLTIALPTDYDCWHESEDDVSAESVMATLGEGTAKARALILAALERMDAVDPCMCGTVLNGAIMTSRDRIPRDAWDRLAPILDRYRKI